MKFVCGFACALALAASDSLIAEPLVDADQKKDFERAVGLLSEGKESEAERSFEDFLRRYPKHSLSDDAQMGLGEILFRQRKFDRALAEYAKVTLMPPNMDRRADAAVRMGECLSKLGRNDEAKIEWEAVIRTQPKSKAAEQARILLAGIK